MTTSTSLSPSIEISITDRGNPWQTFECAIKYAKVKESSINVKFPLDDCHPSKKHVWVDVYPSSNINDLQKILELKIKIYNLENTETQKAL